MAYHLMGRGYEAVAGEAASYDELDACAYQILAALFSLVETELQAGIAAGLVRSATTRRNDYDEMCEALAPLPLSQAITKILEFFNVGAVRTRPGMVDRINRNEQLRTLWLGSFQRLGMDDFKDRIANAMAALLIADLPGNQCIAVVRSNGLLYVTANGVWASGNALGATPGAVAYGGSAPAMIDRPWFPSALQFERALDIVSTDILSEYNARAIVYVNPTQGDFGGKFHAEMQLLEFMLDERILPDRGYIGVSKPCCNFCRIRLDPAGVHYWHGHTIRGADPVDDVLPLYTTFARADVLADFKDRVQNVRFYGAVMPA